MCDQIAIKCIRALRATFVAVVFFFTIVQLSQNECHQQHCVCVFVSITHWATCMRAHFLHLNANLTQIQNLKLKALAFEVIMPFCICHMQHCIYWAGDSPFLVQIHLNLTNLQMEKNATAKNRFVSHYYRGLLLHLLIWNFFI